MSTPQIAPYGRKGSGYSGSKASRQRQKDEDETGVTGFRQVAIFKTLAGFAEHGMTTGEVERVHKVGHGQASGALTLLHRRGAVVRLAERRNRQHVYVLPEHVNGRDQSPYRARFSVNNLSEAEVGMMESAVAAAFRKEMEERTGESVSKLAVAAVLDTIRTMAGEVR